ncbi:hypothetical protein ACFQH2_08140 [Natronoarchaeum sp. GCM10025703]
MCRTETISTFLLQGTPWATAARDHDHILLPCLDDVRRPTGSHDHVALAGPPPV